jgi:hypothetical protein
LVLQESALLFGGGKVLCHIPELNELSAEEDSLVPFCKGIAISNEDLADLRRPYFLAGLGEE